MTITKTTFAVRRVTAAESTRKALNRVARVWYEELIMTESAHILGWPELASLVSGISLVSLM